MRNAIPAHPLISVILPVYNGERYIADAICCIIAQTYPHWELLVIDDGSADGSAAVAGSFAVRDDRISVTRIAHAGLARAINTGIDLSRGDMIARMDADDLCPPERFALQLEWMRTTGVEVCGGSAVCFGKHSGVLWVPETHEGIAREQIFRYPMWAPTVLTHADIFRANRPDETVAADDYELWARLAHRYRLGNMPAVLLKLRCHDQQTHIRDAKGCAADRRRLRPGLIRALFPDAEADDVDTIKGVAEKQPMADIAQLDRAGHWLVRLAQCPELRVRRQMLRRWQQTCRRAVKAAADLAPDVERTYRRYAQQFGLPGTETDAELLAA